VGIADATAEIATASAAAYIANATVGIFPASPPFATAGIANATAGITPASTADATANSIAGIFPASLPTATAGIANATADIAVASATGSTADATAEATTGIFPASPITAATGIANATTGIAAASAAASTAAFVANATVGLFPAFRSLRRPCDDNLYNIGSPRLVQHEHFDWQWLSDWHCWWLWVKWKQLRWNGYTPTLVETVTDTANDAATTAAAGKKHLTPFSKQWWHEPFDWEDALHSSYLSWQLIQSTGKGKSIA
jgi:hypothetical protein